MKLWRDYSARMGWFSKRDHRKDRKEKKDDKKAENKSIVVANKPVGTEPDLRELPESYRETYAEVLDKMSVDSLKRRLIAPESFFKDLGKTETLSDGRFFTFIDNGADILAVAHLDSVQSPKEPRVGYYYNKTSVYSETVDDRVGVYVILDLLPLLGVKADVLLTTGEERGNSSARSFKLPEGKKYKWLFQFDRAGTDLVMYQYETPALKKMMEEEYDYEVGIGSYSDICDLYHLGAKAFNIGTAYYNNHGANAVVVIGELIDQVSRFMKFYKDKKNVEFQHDPKKGYQRVYAGAYAGTLWDDNYNSTQASYWGSFKAYVPPRIDFDCKCGAHILDVKYWPETQCQRCKRMYRRTGDDVYLQGDAFLCKCDTTSHQYQTATIRRCSICSMVENNELVYSLKLGEKCSVCMKPIRKKGKNNIFCQQYYDLTEDEPVCETCAEVTVLTEIQCEFCERSWSPLNYSLRHKVSDKLCDVYGFHRTDDICNLCVEACIVEFEREEIPMYCVACGIEIEDTYYNLEDKRNEICRRVFGTIGQICELCKQYAEKRVSRLDKEVKK